MSRITKQSEPVLAGVEQNEYSRYVDFSICTPWEQLVVDIESSMKSLLEQEYAYLISQSSSDTVIDNNNTTKNSTYAGNAKISSSMNCNIRYSFRATVKYLGTSYSIRLEKKPIVFENSISSWFGLLRYFVISHAQDWLSLIHI